MRNVIKPTYLTPLLCDAHQLAREAVKRRKLFTEKALSAEEIAEHEALGWVFDKKLVKKTRFKKQKVIDERLENRCWMLLFKLGYPELNQGRSFTILVERKGAEPIRKQIDVFGKDDETIVIMECKACEKMSRRSLQKDLEEFANLKGPNRALGPRALRAWLQAEDHMAICDRKHHLVSTRPRTRSG